MLRASPGCLPSPRQHVPLNINHRHNRVRLSHQGLKYGKRGKQWQALEKDAGQPTISCESSLDTLDKLLGESSVNEEEIG